MNDLLLHNYFDALVNRFYKILPMREQDEPYLDLYMQSFRNELLGCNNCIENDAMLMTLVSILQYLIDHQDVPVSEVKREVFRAISVCNKLKDKYSVEGVQI